MKGVRPYFAMMKHLDVVDARRLRHLFLVYALAFSVAGLGLAVLLVRLGLDNAFVASIGVVFVVLSVAMSVSIEYNAPKDWTGPR